jgi:prepilin-type N-terminal cleavage/methylation domain-containing protein
MQRFRKSLQGVTLLEIMLVLAIASMVILMSVRYYKAATQSQSATSILATIQAISGAADRLAGSGQGYTTVTTAGILSVLGSTSALNTQFGSFSVTGTSGISGYAVAFPANTPAGVPAVVSAQLAQNPKYTVTSTGFTFDATR